MRATGTTRSTWASSTCASGRSGDWFVVGFSPRKRNLTLYLMDGFDGFDGYAELLGRLGKHSTGKSCLYVKKLADVDGAVLRELITRSYASATGPRPAP